MKLTPIELSLDGDEITIVLETDEGTELRIEHTFGTIDAFAEALENAALMIRRWAKR